MIYRLATPEDARFILSGWSASLRMSRNVQLIAMATWSAKMRPEIQRVLARRDAVTHVAQGEVLQGFICAAPARSYVFYVYVAQPFRENGIARGLFRAAGIDPALPFGYACQTKASWLLREKAPHAHYDPLYARFPEQEDATP